MGELRTIGSVSRQPTDRRTGSCLMVQVDLAAAHFSPVCGLIRNCPKFELRSDASRDTLYQHGARERYSFAFPPLATADP